MPWPTVSPLYLSEGAAGPDVVTLQRGLDRLGHLVGPCGYDGFWGPATSRAVAAWKAATGRASGLFPGITLDDLAELGAPRREDYDLCSCGACGIKWRFGFETTCFGNASPPFDHDWRWRGRKVTIIGGADLVHVPVTLPSSANPLLEAMDAELTAISAERAVLPSDVLRQIEALKGEPPGSLTWGETSWGSKRCDECGGQAGQHRPRCGSRHPLG